MGDAGSAMIKLVPLLLYKHSDNMKTISQPLRHETTAPDIIFLDICAGD